MVCDVKAVWNELLPELRPHYRADDLLHHPLIVELGCSRRQRRPPCQRWNYILDKYIL
jgi:hypothetical protein